MTLTHVQEKLARPFGARGDTWQPSNGRTRLGGLRGCYVPGGWTRDLLTYAVGRADLPGPLVNTVAVTGVAPLGAVITATDDATIKLVETTYRIWLPIVAKVAQP